MSTNNRVVTLLALFGVALGIGLWWKYSTVPYVHLTCVDRFSQTAFQTDLRTEHVVIKQNAYYLYRSDWTLTIVPRSDNLVCTLSRHYPDRLLSGGSPRAAPE